MPVTRTFDTAMAPPSAQVHVGAASSRLPLSLLVALVVGSILGSGIFGLPQNMAAGAGTGAILIGWLITGTGMLALALALVYQALAMRKPDLNNGVYPYARAAACEYVGFNAAWGYWVSAWIGNVGYLVAAFGALGHFFPAFGDGNTATAIAGASVVLWVVHLLVLRGIRGAAMLNAVATLAKVVPLFLFIALVALAFQAKTFSFEFWGTPKLRPMLAAAGSMGSKVEAACRFAEATGQRALIGSLEHIEAMLEGQAGTEIRRGPGITP